MKESFPAQLEAWYEKAEQISPVRLRTLTRKKLIDYLGLYGFTNGAEIGVDRGRFSKYMFEHIPNLHLYCVDLWWWKFRGESKYQSVLRRLKDCNTTILRKTSLEALDDVPDGSLDFVYIDADHTFDYVMTDIILWSKKVREGGIVAGHDYYRFRRAGVIPAVDIYTQQHGITQWFLTDEKEATWFWAKGSSFVDPLPDSQESVQESAQQDLEE